mmetsp:Transcript_10022/g.24288  ORF Transcript_10022/g.24288 Transcript_10022/m.24288 type:complete len:245 (-) Transcript_10022:171-905(-)
MQRIRYYLLPFLLLSANVVSAFSPSHGGPHTPATTTLSEANAKENEISRRSLMSGLVSSALLIPAIAAINPEAATARLEAVNRPDLLPKEAGLNVIQTEKFLTSGQARRMDQMLSSLERDTGFRLRVLCQSYPNTPGLAIRDYWDLGKEGQKDDKYIVLVVDQFGGKGNVLNFNVGDGVKLALPNVFWTRLAGSYGNLFYVKENGIDLAITNAIESIVTCLRSEDQYCVNVPDTTPSLKSLGFS